MYEYVNDFFLISINLTPLHEKKRQLVISLFFIKNNRFLIKLKNLHPTYKLVGLQENLYLLPTVSKDLKVSVIKFHLDTRYT